MQQLIEFYEMVSLNASNLSEMEKQTILKARLALQVFERAMQSFKAQSERPVATESPVCPTGHLSSVSAAW